MKVKILLEKGESQLDADHALQKALDLHSSGDVHDGEAFDDAAMIHMAQRLEEMHAKMYNEMVLEISNVLDEEFSHGGQ